MSDMSPQAAAQLLELEQEAVVELVRGKLPKEPEEKSQKNLTYASQPPPN
ncbi:MAG: hypothetical protein ChlgKO_04650 [Chlamydiales bacterium]